MNRKKTTSVLGVIPARWGSTRFEGKVLAKINGLPMIQHVWQRARQSERLDQLVVACDNERVFKAAKGFGAEVIMTSPDHATGTDRIVEAVRDRQADIIVNIQGDEPLIHCEVIDALVTVLQQDVASVMATAIKVIQAAREIDDPNVVKAVVDQKGYALYFSRAHIPYDRAKSGAPVYKHLGLYAYRKSFLLNYSKLPPSTLESVEKLEQLRALEAGYKIKTVLTDYETIGVDTPEDLARVEAMIRGK